MKTRSAAKKTSRTRSAPGSKTSKRQLIDTGSDKRYVRRRPNGEFKQSVGVGRSLAADRRSKSTTKAKKGQGDRGDE
jgi:hypothetical protein